MSKDYNIDDILSEVQKRREENKKEIIAKAEQEQEVEVTEAPAEPEAEQEPETETVAEEENDKTVETQEEFVSAEEIESEPENIEDEVDEKPKKKAKKKAKKQRTKKQKIMRAIISILLVLVIIAGAGGLGAYFYFDNMINKITASQDEKETKPKEQEWAGMDGDAENFTPIFETEADQLSSLQDMMKNWYYNGTPASSSKVLNVLLIGEDTRGSEILDNGTRADAAIIASINSETKEITLTSILRDAYAYFETTPNDESTGRFDKINAAMSLGGIDAYINCVENLYKINIDNYVIVNFDSFEAIIDTLDGVSIKITSAEINEINNHPKRYNHTYIEKDFEGNSGTMTLNGKQALAYCRIRKLDSDNMRADRQKTTLVKLFKKAKKSSTSKLLKVVNELVPYVSTGFNKNEIVKIAKYAIKQDWLEFDTKMTSVPEHNLKGGIYYGAWCWKCDFPQDAYNLQMKIYGKSSITLAHTRVDTAKCAEKGFYNEGASRVWATVTNNNYGEVTTLPPEDEED